jgi:hypothetical protein
MILPDCSRKLNWKKVEVVQYIILYKEAEKLNTNINPKP